MHAHIDHLTALDPATKTPIGPIATKLAACTLEPAYDDVPTVRQGCVAIWDELDIVVTGPDPIAIQNTLNHVRALVAWEVKGPNELMGVRHARRRICMRHVQPAASLRLENVACALPIIRQLEAILAPPVCPKQGDALPFVWYQLHLRDSTLCGADGPSERVSDEPPLQALHWITEYSSRASVGGRPTPRRVRGCAPSRCVSPDARSGRPSDPADTTSVHTIVSTATRHRRKRARP